jgi:NADPH:quinone reductase-like Zn-dependent oxidoreductase
VPVPDSAGFPVPAGVAPGLAAALGVAGLVGWVSLDYRAHLQTGETVLVLGAGGAAVIRNKMLTLVGQGTVGTPAEVRRSAYAQLMRHATDVKFTLDLEQTRLGDISRTWEHLKAGPPRKLVVTP